MPRQIGWFDWWRDDGGPTWYGDNRTPVIADFTTVSIVTFFAIFLFAFLIILPGIRRERWSSFFSVVLTLSAGATILVCIHHPCWHVGDVRILSSYRAFTAEKLDAVIGVRVGLKHVNITLTSHEPLRPSDNRLLRYNERFFFSEVKSMERELNNGLHKGLPYPILSVIEFLSVDRAGFVWGRQYRLAGYYTCIFLWLCFGFWLLQVVMLCLVPQFFSRVVAAVGAALWLATAVYAVSCPKRLLIRFAGVDGRLALLDMHFGWCFWLTLGLGTVCVLCGLVIRLLEVKAVCRFTTFLQSDFDEAFASPNRRLAPPRHRHDSRAEPPSLASARQPPSHSFEHSRV